MKLEDFMKVDLDNLWKACENHLPALEYFTKDLPDLKYNYAMLKLRISKYMSELDRHIRERAAEEGVKITEKAIENAIERDERLYEMRQEMLELKKKIDELERIRMLFEHRRDMIKVLATIFSASGADVIADRQIQKIVDKFSEKDYYETLERR